MTRYRIVVARQWIATSNRNWMLSVFVGKRIRARVRGGLRIHDALAKVGDCIPWEEGDTATIEVAPDTTTEQVKAANRAFFGES